MRLTRPMVAVLVLGVMGPCLVWSPAVAQQRPALTEDPQPIPEGKMLLEMGVDHAWNQTFPVSGLEGKLLRAPLLGISIALGRIAELQVDGISLSRLSISRRFEAPLSDLVTARGDRTSSVDDFVVGTKVRLLSETASRPAIGLRFATRLPNAGNEKGIGLDTMDFFQDVLIGKSFGKTRFIGRFGVAFLSDPTRGDRQNDVFTYGFSVVQDLRSVSLVLDANGHVSTRPSVPPPGTQTRGTATFGFRYSRGALRFDAGFYSGLTSDDGRTGLTGGLTWTFDNFLERSEPSP